MCRLWAMKQTVATLAEQISAQITGDPGVEVERFAAVDEADSRSLCPMFSQGALSDAPAQPGAVLADKRCADIALKHGVRAALVLDNPVLGLAALINIFYPEPDTVFDIHPTAFVHSTATLHPPVSVGPCAVVEAFAVIGEDSVIGPGAIICRGAVLGKRVRIGPGAVIGHEGFGYVPHNESLVKVRQVGRVIIEDDVEIGANACVDRGTLGTTRIGCGTKLDNLVQIGHNARIGRSVVLAGQVGIAGSVIIEDHAMIGGQAGVADHLTVGAGAKVAAKSGVIANVAADTVVAGYPAMPRVRWLRFFAGAKEKRPMEQNRRKDP